MAEKSSQQKRQRSSSPLSANKKVKTERLPKPPYSYTGMIIIAIEQHPMKTMTAAQVFESLRQMFPYFATTYSGWKATVRKTMNLVKCFERQDHSDRGIRWTVDYNQIPSNTFKLQERSPLATTGEWAPTLFEQLNIPVPVLLTSTACYEPAHTPSVSTVFTSVPFTYPSTYIQPDFEFNIDSILPDISRYEETDDARRTDCFDGYDIDFTPVFPPRLDTIRPKPRQITQTQKYRELEQTVNNHAFNLFVSPEIAIDNLRMLCDSFTPICSPRADQQLTLVFEAQHLDEVKDSADIPTLVNISLQS